MKKKITPIFYITLWSVMLVLLGIYYVALAPRDSSFSDTENRTLAGFPEVSMESVFSGRFGEDIENYLLDHFPGRDSVIMAVNRMENAVSFASHDEYLLIAEDVEDPLDTDDYLDNLDDLLASLEQNQTPPTEPEENRSDSTEPEETQPENTEPGEDPPIEQKPPVNIEDYPATLGKRGRYYRSAEQICAAAAGKRKIDVYDRPSQLPGSAFCECRRKDQLP